MSQRHIYTLGTVGFMAALLVASPAHAGRLELGADASALARFGANAILYLHIAGGTVGLIAGVIASLSRGGNKRHRLAGRIFFGSMFVTYLIGATVAPFLDEGQRPNFVGGILALYLLVTGVMAARRRKFEAGPPEYVGLVVALFIVTLGVAFIVMAAQSDTGTVDGSPPQAFIVFVLAGLAAVAGDIQVIVKGRLNFVDRTSRHLWRMCGSFFLASASLFFGQPQIFPAWFVGSALQGFFAFFPLLVMVLSLVKLRLDHRRKKSAA